MLYNAQTITKENLKDITVAEFIEIVSWTLPIITLKSKQNKKKLI
jgi:hypothetical protein